jgi:hypothetical protein
MRNYLGNNLVLKHDEQDLEKVQFMLDDEVYEAGRSDELLGFGVILGNVFHAQTSMKWATVTNNYGRLIAVHDPAIAFTLYPIQMIVQRVEDGRKVDALLLYRSFVNDLKIGK